MPIRLGVLQPRRRPIMSLFSRNASEGLSPSTRVESSRLLAAIMAAKPRLPSDIPLRTVPVDSWTLRARQIVLIQPMSPATQGCQIV